MSGNARLIKERLEAAEKHMEALGFPISRARESIRLADKQEQQEQQEDEEGA